MRKIIFTLFSNLLLVASFAQMHTIKGRVTNSAGNFLSSINIVIKGSGEGTYTDNNGKFLLKTNKNIPLLLVITAVEFKPLEMQVTTDQVLAITLEPAVAMLKEVAVASSRIPTRILEAPVSIEKLGLKMLESNPAPSAYDAIATLKGVDFTTSSLTFKTPSTRGFNNSGSPRVNQLMDGMDNQAPGLNFFVGNLVGSTDLDLESIELLPGASSALYGPGGMNGTILTNSKNPFIYQGLTVQIKEGMMNADKRQRDKITPYSEWSVRYAKAFSNRFAFKFSSQYLSAKDWIAADSSNYLRSGDAGKVIAGTRSTDPNYDGVNIYGDETTTDIKQFIPEPYRSSLPFASIPVSRTGYTEKDIVNPEAKNLKITGALHYKITNNVEASLAAFWGKGSSIYTGSDRYALKNVKIGQYKLELRSNNWFVRGYTTQEDAGDSYASTTVARYLNEVWSPSETSWYPAYIGNYLGALGAGLDNAAAHTMSRIAADKNRPQPGSVRFNRLLDSLKRIPISRGGGLFLDKSDLWMVEGQYNFSNIIRFADILVGGNYKKYILNSQGTIFIDTSGTIPIYEAGGYIQASKKMFRNFLTLSASERYDKNENFSGKFTPRFTALVKLAENNNLRLSYQTAYRFPSTQQQFIYLQTGSNEYLLGGLPWITALTNPKGGTSFTINDNKPYRYKEFKPEISRSFEIGYKGLVNDKLLIDAYGYLCKYKDFLGRTIIYEPSANHYYSIVVNSDNKVKTYGYGMSLNYLISKSFTASANLYSDKIRDVSTGFISSYNTPAYRLNIGLSNSGFGKRKKLGFALQYKWQDAFRYENDFANGAIEAFSTMDAQISYKILKGKSGIRVGGSNLLNHYYRNGFGSPRIGALYYISLQFQIL